MAHSGLGWHTVNSNVCSGSKGQTISKWQPMSLAMPAPIEWLQLHAHCACRIAKTVQASHTVSTLGSGRACALTCLLLFELCIAYLERMSQVCAICASSSAQLGLLVTLAGVMELIDGAAAVTERQLLRCVAAIAQVHAYVWHCLGFFCRAGKVSTLQ